ncbi:restriction endonuclease subunit S [Salmonella enterica subsp. enterica serovar Saintpaul]|uniref:Restriction endonuclease subunit S n=1 Tax=Salmonella enterica TaxID=28901 RepID=A0A753TEW2_SALER|nr:restriction endonuclease subunit S [Salmonella enterica subsp. enterica serovar Saintpaul]EEJ9085805.1 restriction endonuclease subunit S [Salmonella enterica subsp. salamae]EJG8584002.1 restriction endonuclease subunit S [Salmonella enterica]HDJ1768175.1 restriction endonuclease subunit S [Salmonella enterica subsp. enterica serovar Saintpaul str. CFSAN004165]ECL0894413.1 restriction endonuclease subunit S [Salmonella enterica subsp. enterica serovar Saintpaul]
MSGGKLPEGWVKTTIGVICEVKGGKRLPKGKALLNTATEHPYIRVTDFENGSVNLSTIKYLDSDTYSAISNYTISKNDLYISIAGTIGLIGEIPEQLDNANLTENAAKLCFILGTDKKYLKHVLSSNKTIEQFDDKTTSSGQPKLALFRIRDCEFPYAPINEQKIIAEKLDTLLAQVDSTKARLEQIPQILKRFRQAVLAMALNGSSEQSRNPTKIVKLIDVTKKITDGEHLTPKTINSGIPLLSAKDVQEDELLFDNVKYLSDIVAAKALNRCNPEKNDILIVSRGATVGRTHLVSTSKTFCLMGSVLLIKLDTEQVVPEYMKLIFNDISGQQQLVSASGATAQQAIYIRDVKEFSFKLISLHEQHEIVRRVEQLFAWADTIEKQVNSALTRVNSLTQSILAKAFRGELTAQWRAENPDLISGENSAAALLEKIKAERAASGGKKTSRKKA